MKRNLIIVLLIFVIYGCEKIPNDIVDYNSSQNLCFNMKSITIDTVVNFVNNIDSTINFKLSFSNLDFTTIKLLKISTLLLDNGKVYDEKDINVENGKLIYTDSIIVKKSYPSGRYRVKFEVLDKNNISDIITMSYFNSYGTSYQPTVKDISAPDTVTVNQSFVLSAKVANPFNYLNIMSVNAVVSAPDADNIATFVLYDDGAASNGDAKASDGIYSCKKSFNTSAKKGKWKFTIIATNDIGLESIPVVKYIVLK